MILEEHKLLAQGTARLAAKVIDGDEVNEYLEKNGNVEGYLETKALLQEILLSSMDISFLYVYRIEEDGCHVVFDIDTEEVAAESIGSVIPYDAGFTESLPMLLKGEEVEPVLTNDEYGYLLTAYQPVYDSQGNTVCYAGADVDMRQLDTDGRSFLMEMISVFLGFFVLLCSLVTWLTDYHIIYPIRAMTLNADRISFADDSDKNLNDNVKAIRRIDIHTGDEIEMLYQSFCQTTLNQAEQMRSIRRLSDSTAKMQDGLIITMADMVENRDSDTGAHIQKTAAYVKIIVEGLRKKGYYAEKLTPKFMSDVVRSAPLHDIGKINIPDAVLNKPGKLTDEEYEIMKTHALKSSARIIGALGLSKMAADMEDAGNREDRVYIDANVEALLKDYLSYEKKLERLHEEGDDSDKDMIPNDMLKDAYSALTDVIPQMDYDSVEMILESLKEYSLPEEDDKRIKEVHRMLKSFDWEGMEALICGDDLKEGEN